MRYLIDSTTHRRSLPSLVAFFDIQFLLTNFKDFLPLYTNFDWSLPIFDPNLPRIPKNEPFLSVYELSLCMLIFFRSGSLNEIIHNCQQIGVNSNYGSFLDRLKQVSVHDSCTHLLFCVQFSYRHQVLQLQLFLSWFFACIFIQINSF